MTVTDQPADLYWDPYDYGLHADPHPTWRRMREEAPLYYNEKFDFWAVTRFDDVSQVLVDWRTYSSAEGDILEVIRNPVNEYTDSLIQQDPPRHDIHRQMLSRVFTPRAVQRIQDRVRSYARSLLDDLAGATTFDFIEEYGARIPALVIAAMLGTPGPGRRRHPPPHRRAARRGRGRPPRPLELRTVRGPARRVLPRPRAGPPEEPHRRHHEHAGDPGVHRRGRPDPPRSPTSRPASTSGCCRRRATTPRRGSRAGPPRRWPGSPSSGPSSSPAPTSSPERSTRSCASSRRRCAWRGS